MKPAWKISGTFFGWFNDQGEFYNSNGQRIGTIKNNVLYDSNAKYIGDLLNEQYIGKDELRTHLIGVICDDTGKIEMDPKENLIGLDSTGYTDPEV